MKPRSPRPGKLRTQVLVGVLLITLGALAVFDVAAVTAVRTYLLSQTDGTLKSALTATRPHLNELLPQSRRPGFTAQVPALNGMLGRIEASVAEREASQELMRRFLAEASHELRTPLASLRASAELYTQGARTERSQVDEAMRRIMLEAQRMGRLVDDMLRLARLDQHPARQRDPVDLSALAADCVERSQIADPRRTWQARITPGLVAVGDQEMLCRAVDNLLANVCTHTPEGTTAVITGYAEGDRVVVGVSDNGPGVPPDRLPRIFDRFYRAGTPAQRPGSGLGLAIVTEIAAAHDGTVTAAANWPTGLRVTLGVPAWQPSGSRLAGADQGADQGAGNLNHN